MPFHYTITVEPTDAAGTPSMTPPLMFRVSNHDDLFAVLSKVEAREAVPPAEAAEFIIGLKLFLEVLIRHRKAPLFEDLWQPMSDFMKRLKGIAPR